MYKHYNYPYHRRHSKLIMNPYRQKQKQNNTELRYENVILKPMMLLKEIIDYKFEPFNVRLGENCYYRFDYFVVFPNRFEVHEIKGGKRIKKTGEIRPYCTDDAMVKIKSAATIYPWWKWIIKYEYNRCWYTMEIN